MLHFPLDVVRRAGTRVARKWVDFVLPTKFLACLHGTTLNYLYIGFLARATKEGEVDYKVHYMFSVQGRYMSLSRVGLTGWTLCGCECELATWEENWTSSCCASLYTARNVKMTQSKSLWS
jgi:hypothetical protein